MAAAVGKAFKDVLPYFRKLETDVDFGDAPYHGNSGPLPVYRAPIDQWGTVDRALREAALGLGYPWCADHNAPTGTGVTQVSTSGADGSYTLARVTAGTVDAGIDSVGHGTGESANIFATAPDVLLKPVARVTLWPLVSSLNCWLDRVLKRAE